MRFAAIDLSTYPVPDAIELLDSEALIAARKAGFLARCEAAGMSEAELADIVQILTYEFEPIVGLLENDAFKDLTMIARINDKVRAVMLATAMDADLDHIGATYYRTPRRLITPADPANGIDAVFEDNETYRRRLALAPESWSTAGPEGAYLFWALSASGDILDVAVYSEDEGVCLAPEIHVVLLLRDGVPDARRAAITIAVQAALNRSEIRPIGDKVVVEFATRSEYSVAMTLQVRDGASSDLIKAAARKKVQAYTEGRIRWAGDAVVGPVWLIGRRIRLSTLAAAGRVDGVEEVILNWAGGDVNAPVPNSVAHLFIAPICSEIVIETETVAAGWTS